MTSLDRDQVLAWLRQHVPKQRVKHILQVEQTAEVWASLHDLDPEKARQAGLLHDLAKFYPPKRLLSMAAQHGCQIHPIERQHPHLLHAPVSAIEAKQIFGIQDSSVLDAIRYHTLGAVPMDRLSMVVFLADSLEPGRGQSDKLNRLRAWSQEDLPTAVWKTCDYTMKRLIKQSQIIHPQMLETRNWAMTQAKQKKDDKL